MASSDELPGPYPARGGGDKIPPGDPTTMKTMMLDKGAAMLQSLKPIKQMSLHMCSFACYGHDPSRQIEAHFYVHRVNEDFLQCAVYDCDSAKTHLIGIEYIVSERLFESLSSEEQKLWHSHDYEIQTGLLVTPRVPELVAKPELQNIAKTYGKFWCTWQTDRGDKLPLGAPALMMSPQDVNMGKIKPGLLKKRDDEYGISTESLKSSRADIVGLERKNPMADYWVHHGKGLAVDIVETDMKKCAPFP
ncbi:Oil body-associated protein 2A [Hirschfeldia incana]|nr:Oil body-associated protein 2A [Hirschfeldia incana]